MNAIFEFVKLRIKLTLASTKDKYGFLHNKKKFIICLAANYANLGDVAITYAQALFIQKYFHEYEIVELPISNTISDLKALKRMCTKEDIITIVGGGNMGDLYPYIELLRLLIICEFPKNQIISFPQTIDFMNSSLSGQMLSLMRKIYGRHKNLILCARESISFSRMKQIFPNKKVYELPDIVMMLDERNPKMKRNGVLFCFRQDKERLIKGDFIKELSNNLNEPITQYDTYVSKDQMTEQEKKTELNRIWSAFRSSKWIITDRLHGMIFAFITGTPAIVLPNNNFKIKGCFEWIKNCGYIYFLDKLDIIKIKKTISTIPTFKYEEREKYIQEKYSLFASNIRKSINKNKI